MTIAVEGNPQQVTGTGDQTAFGTVFLYFEDSDVIVTQRITATGVEAVMVQDTHYSISGGSTTGAVGTITPIAGATNFTSAMTWTVERDIPLTQSTSYTDADLFPATSHEVALDRLTLIVQDLKAKLDNRCLKVPVTDLVAADVDIPSSVDRASTALTFDSSGDVTVT